MSFALKNIIWPLFGKWEDKRDTYKVNGKGILRRYNEILADDFDQETLPFIADLQGKTMDPTTMMDRFIPYWEALMNTPMFDEDIELRRKILRYSSRFNQIAGTTLGYKVLFRFTGIECTVQEVMNYSRFDDGLKFDKADRRFDGSPEAEFQTPYRLILYGPPSYTTQQIENIISTVVWANEPVDAKYIGYTYNPTDVMIFFDETFFNESFYN
jgi:hypothetical protein